MSVKVNEAMEFSSWCKCAEAADGLLNLLDENRNVTLSILVTEDEENLTVSSSVYKIHGFTYGL